MRKIFGGLLLALFASGCAITQQASYEYRQSLLGPVPLNEPGADPRAALAMDAPVSMYYALLPAAISDRGKVPDFVDAGIAATDIRCLQWFGRISDAQRQSGLSSKNLGVLQNLGTTVLGLISANPVAVTSYGALNVAISGFTENFNAAILTAPSQHAAKVAVLGLMSQSADELRLKSRGMSFPQAFSALERYGALCSFETISAIVSNALGVTVTTVQPSGALRSSMRREGDGR